jgi:hypothetical protein
VVGLTPRIVAGPEAAGFACGGADGAARRATTVFDDAPEVGRGVADEPTPPSFLTRTQALPQAAKTFSAGIGRADDSFEDNRG